MQTITTIGLDIAKSVFQVHGVDNDGKVVIRRQLKRRYVLAFFEKLQPCLVGIDKACASSQFIGHASCRYFWPYRAVDAAGLRQALRQTAEERCGRTQSAICEAVTRTNMRVCASQDARATKRADAPSHAPSVHPRQQTSVDQCDPGSPCRVLASPQRVSGAKASRNYCGVIADPSDKTGARCCPRMSCRTGQPIAQSQKADLDFDRMIMAWHRSNQTSKRLIASQVSVRC